MQALHYVDLHQGFVFHGGAEALAVRLYWDGDEWAVTPRADFAEQFARADKVLPPGPKWTLTRGGHILAVGGLRHHAGETWLAWAYCSAMRPCEWAFGAKAARMLIERIKLLAPDTRVHALAAPTPEAERLMRRIGFDKIRTTPTPDWLHVGRDQIRKAA